MNRMLIAIRLACLLAGAWSLVPATGFAAERYAAMFSDGGRVEEAEVREWFEPASVPKIGGRALFDGAAPARWIIDRQQPPTTESEMFVEFFGGDRLSGEVVSFRADSGLAYEQQPAHLIVKPFLEVQPPDDPLSGELRVATEWLRRVVWQRVAREEYRPGTVWLRNGKTFVSRLPVRSRVGTSAATGVSLASDSCGTPSTGQSLM